VSKDYNLTAGNLQHIILDTIVLVWSIDLPRFEWYSSNIIFGIVFFMEVLAMLFRVFVLCLSLCLLSSCDLSKDVASRSKLEGPRISEDMPAGQVSLFDGASLGQWKITAFDEPGKVYAKDESIVMEAGNEMTGITWGGGVLRRNYEINLDAMRVDGEDFFCGLTFPIDDSCVTFIVGGWGGNVSGISSVNYYDASDNETTVKKTFDNGRWYHIRVRVSDGKIQCWIDDKQYVDLETAGKRLDVRSEVEDSQPLGIASYGTSSAIKNIRLTKLADTPVSLSSR